MGMPPTDVSEELSCKIDHVVYTVSISLSVREIDSAASSINTSKTNETTGGKAKKKVEK